MSSQGCSCRVSNLALQVCSVNGSDDWKWLRWPKSWPFARPSSSDCKFFVIRYFWVVLLAYYSPRCYLQFLFTNQELITCRKSPKFEYVRSRIMDFDLILSNCRLISKNCDSLKLQDLETIISAYGHKWCRSRVYPQRSKGNYVWRTLKVIESSQVICLISNVLNHNLFFSELCFSGWSLLILQDWWMFLRHVCFGNEVPF